MLSFLLIFDSILFYRYENNNNRVMSVSAAAQLLSVTLYGRRFFPYYAFNMFAGLDENGKYTYIYIFFYFHIFLIFI